MLLSPDDWHYIAGEKTQDARNVEMLRLAWRQVKQDLGDDN